MIIITRESRHNLLALHDRYIEQRLPVSIEDSESYRSPSES